MTQNQHTPGPWEYFGPGNAQVYGGDPKRRICVLDRLTGADMSEDYANARLIAAAPDLLAALEIASAALMRARAFVPDNIDPQHVAAQDKVYAAIAKATGQ